ncbi:hypothetical protein SBBP1_480013 [Burkholderiales bacterium]|nr:hypothetical protein SBBP1_480013 [Burkholderiales bacterium]
MRVQAGFSGELWHWLLEQGWREVRYRPDRRRYREIPASCVTELIDAPPEERQPALAFGVEKASRRPNVGDGAFQPPSLLRH